MSKIVTLNKQCISQMYAMQAEPIEFTYYILEYKKGEIVKTGILFRKKFKAEDDLYVHCLTGKLYYKYELNKDFKEEHEAEFDAVYEEKEGTIYKKPHVVIKMSNGDIYRKYFSTYYDCDSFIKDMIDKNQYFENFKIDERA